MVILWGSLINLKGLKYTRVSDYYRDNDSPFRRCNRLLLDLTTPDSQVCCDGRRDDWLCRASYDEQARFFTSNWAWIIPLSFPLTTMIGEAFSLFFQPSVFNSISNKQSSHSNGGIAFFSSIKPLIQLFEDSFFGRYVVIMIRTLIRCTIYFMIAVFRAYILYLLPYYLTEISTASTTSKCWCPTLVSNKKCLLNFDFSDHIVLSIVQYVFPAMLELNYIFINKFSGVSKSNMSTLLFYLFYSGPILFLLLIIGINLKLMFFTTLFFHSPIENIVGMLLGLIWLSPLLNPKYIELWYNITKYGNI